jgi:replicative DNA helicase
MKEDTNKFPNSEEAEHLVIGAVLLEQDAISLVVDFLQPEMFYSDKISRVYDCAIKMFRAGFKIDIITITEQLGKIRYEGGGTVLKYVGGAYYITRLTDRVGSSSNIETHARIVCEHHVRRELMLYAARMNAKINEGRDIFEVESLVSDMQMLFNKATASKSEQTMQRLANEAVTGYEERKKSAILGIVPGVPTGIRALDKKTGGLQKTDLIVLAARPAMGKTSLAVQIAKHVAETGCAVGVFSLEMSARQLFTRLLIQQSQMDGKAFNNGNLFPEQEQEMKNAAAALSRIGIFIDDTPGLEINGLRGKAKRWKIQNNISLIIVDYMQLVSSRDNRGNREREISEISRTLKIIAKELDVPVIALSQLSRKVEERGGDKRPILSDLRESGAIEQDADIVAFLYRAEYYGFEQDAEGQSTKNKAEVIIAKFRNGQPGTVEIGFTDYLTRFHDIHEQEIKGSTLAGITPNEDFLNKEPF